jgi:hypothetical protein
MDSLISKWALITQLAGFNADVKSTEAVPHSYALEALEVRQGPAGV